MGLMIAPYMLSAAGGGLVDGETFTANLKVASGKVGSDLTDFVMLVSLHDMPGGFWSAVKSDGGDIRVYDNSDTLIPHDLCTFATGSTSGILMLKKTLLAASDNFIKIRCGNASLSQLPSSDTNGRNAMWNGYDWVSGFDGTTTDRTGASRTVGGNTPTYGSVRPHFFKFTEDQIITWDTLTHRSAYTAGASYYDTRTISNHEGIWSYCDKTSPTSDRQGSAIKYPSGNFATWNPSDSWIEPVGSDQGDALNTLFRGVGTFNGTSGRKVYLDGVQKATSGSSTVRPTSGTRMGIGGSGVAGEGFNGEIGFCYLRNGILSADWLAAEAANWHNPSGFYTVS